MLTRLRAMVSGVSLIALAAVIASLEPASPGPTGLAPASLFAVRRAAAQTTPAAETTFAAVLDPVARATPARMDDVVDPPAIPEEDVAAPEPVSPPPAIVEHRLGKVAFDEVRWTVERTMRLEEVANNWGMWVEELRELNPELRGAEWIEAPSSIVVHRRDPRRPTQSVGAPNRGHLLGGIPLPEGPHWRLREHRPRAFGSRTTIAALLEALSAYGAADPSAPPVRIGEISRRAGGRIAPHVSHRSGRDVDIGYVLKTTPGDNERFWRIADKSTVDAPRTWALIEALIATGEVQQIFISAKLQPIIAREAAKQLAPEDLALVFSAINPDATVHTLIKHESGHRDHMHVRFLCEPGNLRCRSQSRESGQ